jgi:anti-sigma factor RsiW
MACNEILNTQALFDGALEGEAARAAERHRDGCADCMRLWAEMESVRNAIRRSVPRHTADADLRARIAAALDAEEAGKVVRLGSLRPRAFWLGALNGTLVTAAAAAVAFFFLMTPETDELVGDVTSAHIRSMVGNHLVDVSTDRPAVAASWLKSHAGLAFNVSPPKGAVLVGARADYVYEASAAVAVYRVHNRVVNVFAWTAREDEDLPKAATGPIYNIAFWKRGNVVFCAVGNLPVETLESFAHNA